MIALVLGVIGIGCMLLAFDWARSLEVAFINAFLMALVATVALTGAFTIGML